MLENTNTYDETEWHVARSDIHVGVNNFWNAGGSIQQLEEIIFEALGDARIVDPGELLILDIHLYTYRFDPRGEDEEATGSQRPARTRKTVSKSPKRKKK